MVRSRYGRWEGVAEGRGIIVRIGSGGVAVAAGTGASDPLGSGPGEPDARGETTAPGLGVGDGVGVGDGLGVTT